MTDIFTLDERKGTVKCEPHMLLSAILKKMLLSGKECGDIVDYNGLQRDPCTVKAVQDLIHEFEETGCTCD